VESRQAARGYGSAEAEEAAQPGGGSTPWANQAGAEEGEAINLEHAGIRAHLLVPEGEGKSIGTYLVHIALPDGNQEIRENRDGTITGAWLEDLDKDGNVDLAVAMASAGSGSYPTIHFFQQTGQTFQLRPLKDLSEAQRAGYRGHDTIEVKDGILFRSFPRYQQGDPNASPSGSSLTLRYSFTDDAWMQE
jgi:hypothetical protein